MTSGTIKIAVDQTVQNVIESEIEVFQNNYPDAKIVPIYTTEQEAIELFKKDTVLFGNRCKKINCCGVRLFSSKNIWTEVIRVAIDGVAIITNPVNRDSMISVRDLKRVQEKLRNGIKFILLPNSVKFKLFWQYKVKYRTLCCRLDL